MVDFFMVSTRTNKRGIVEIYPKFLIKRSSDLMIRGGDFYAVWLDEAGIWSTDEQDCINLIDKILRDYFDQNKESFNGMTRVMYCWDAESGVIDSWHKYCQKQMRDNFHMLDEKLVFDDDPINKKDYSSKRLKYCLREGDISAYDELMSVLYSEDERHKIEWAIGSIVSGDSKKIQKFLVLYGAMGTGKSTVLNIIQDLFDGYYCVFDAKALGSASNSFALEAFRSNPLVAIQHDGDLSRIEDNTRLNSLVSHELMTVNEKFKSTYANRFKCFLFMGTNKPVKITDAKSGLIRRLIDVSPTGNKVSQRKYKELTKQIGFELGAIAYHCLEVYQNDPGYYDDYVPLSMMGASNDFYNFVADSSLVFMKDNGVSLKIAWEMYKQYCDYAKVGYPFSQRLFKEELKNYFDEYFERYTTTDGNRIRSYYSGFRLDKIEGGEKNGKTLQGKAEIRGEGVAQKAERGWIDLKPLSETEVRILRLRCGSEKAQLATGEGIPGCSWRSCKTSLSETPETEVHYVKLPENHIVIDFDLKDQNGNKSLEKNIEAANKWPPTYAEVSKSGQGLHLHYIYNGDVTKLANVYDKDIEIKTFTGGASLRRKLTLCNELDIATLSSGLPLKEVKKVTNPEKIKSEKSLRNLIVRNLNKEIHPGTKPSMDFILKILDEAYESGLRYDLTDMKNALVAFAANSTNHAPECLKMVKELKLKSAEDKEDEPFKIQDEEDLLIFFDIEIFPNLFLVCWKTNKSDKIVAMRNPGPEMIAELITHRLIGFNNRKYDNHMLYACMVGYTVKELYELSQSIIMDKKGFFGEAYNLSYTDIYDFASAGNKKSLKKLEIEMGIHHQELGLPWDQPVPEELWDKVEDYCKNDVFATEKAFEYLKADWTARCILADLAEMSVNDTTNQLTTRIIFGREKHPQNEFCYRDMSQPVKHLDKDIMDFLYETCPEMMDCTIRREGVEPSLLPYFPEYEFKNGVSTYRGFTVGEGGFVYSEPGAYGNVALLDIASMHPHSTIAECLFGPEFTRAFTDIVEGRVDIKHEAWDVVEKMLDGKLAPYIEKVKNGEMTSKDLANALKTAINSVYGLTAANFDNPFKDPRNIDNIVAKRGALFMIDLLYEVQARGFKVAHIKTDSIKIPDATPEIIDFVYDFGKRYGYTFEHEATYDKMCLVNKAVYIAKYNDGPHKYVLPTGEKVSTPWTATGEQFAVPYVFKTLFSGTELQFHDFCETKSTSSSIYLDMNEGLKENEHNYVFVGRTGQFTPVNEGSGGGILLRAVEGTKGYRWYNYVFVGRTGQSTPIREKDGKYYAVEGTKGYRWMESEMVKTLGLQNEVNMEYYKDLLQAAIDTIENYTDPDWFVSDEPYNGHIPDGLPF